MVTSLSFKNPAKIESSSWEYLGQENNLEMRKYLSRGTGGITGRASVAYLRFPWVEAEGRPEEPPRASRMGSAIQMRARPHRGKTRPRFPWPRMRLERRVQAEKAAGLQGLHSHLAEPQLGKDELMETQEEGLWGPVEGQSCLQSWVARCQGGNGE